MFRPEYFWNAISAERVAGSNIPSTGPVSSQSQTAGVRFLLFESATKTLAASPQIERQLAELRLAIDKW
jgi:hypothetical protein